jgi:quinol monooxygenase YgiN
VDAINLELNKLKASARKRSVVEQWETAAVLKAFLARSHWKAWQPRTAQRRHDGGLQSATDHSGLNH